MPRLPRPPIHTETKCRVAMKQLGEMWPDNCIESAKKARALGHFLAGQLQNFADLLRCEVTDLRLDHDPPLGARRKVFDRSGRHVDYIPAANDIEHLFYRPHGPQFAGSHLVKTNVRGDRGQYPDRVLIVRNRKLEKRLAEEGSRPSRKPAFLVEKPQRRPRKKWSKPMRSANRWPPRGSQKLQRKPK